MWESFKNPREANVLFTWAFLFYADNTYSIMKKGVIYMIKIVRNNSGIETLKKHKYVFRIIVDGVEMYSKIGLKPIIGAILGHFKYH